MDIVKEYIEINGLRQNIMTMSTDVGNPVLLIVHGGPGLPDRPLIRKYSGSLAEYYTVVCWDQRGSGLSYTKGPLSINGLLADLKILTEYLRERYNQGKIYIAGHSWGAYLGLRFTAMCPGYVEYYIGTGQEISAIKEEIDRFSFVKEQALKRDDKRVLRKLDYYGEPDGYSYGKADKKAKLYISVMIIKYAGYFHKNDLISAFRLIPLYFGYYRLNIFRLIAGAVKSLTTLFEEMKTDDPVSEITELETSVLLISGEEDMICPLPTAQRWFENLNAPKKEFVIINNASHMVNFEKPREWNRLLINLLPKDNPDKDSE